MANFHLRSSRDSGTSVRDEKVRTKNIKEGRGNSTAERKKKFKPKTPKGVTREEMSGKSDAPAKPKAAAPKPKAKSPFALPSKAPVPTPRPDPIVTGAAPAPYMYSGPTGPVPGQSMAGTETAPAPAPYMYPATPPTQPAPFPPDLAASPPRPDNFQQPPGAFRPPMEGPPAINPAMLQSVPPELRAKLAQSMAGRETAPRPPLPTPLEQMPGQLPGYDGLSELRKIMGFG